MRALAAFCSLLVCVVGSAGPAPLPAGIELEPRGEVTVIVSVGGFSKDIPWREITALLPVFAGVGADTLALWPIWAHIGSTEAIPVRTPTGPRDLRVGAEIHHWVPTDYTALDPHRGTEEEFRRLVDEAHRLGLKVVPILQVTYALPGGFIYEHHPEWLLRSETGGYAVTWPWYRAPWGYALDKSHPGLIEFVTGMVLPHWIEGWGVDGVWLDSPGMQYCSPRVREILARIGAAPGAECLTPVGEEISAEPLARAMCAAIEDLEGELGRELVCAAETPIGGWADFPDAYIEALAQRDVAAARSALEDAEVGASCAPYWDWFCDYLFRDRLMDVYLGGELSYSRTYVEQFELEARSPIPQGKRARFVNQLNGWARYLPLLEPEVAGCYITLAATAPGRTFWIEGADLVLPEHRELLRAWYERLVAIKRAFPALQNTDIEDAFLEPQVRGLIAYNRWAGDESVTVVVNTGDRELTARVRTRFAGKRVELVDLLQGEELGGDPRDLAIRMPPRTARILVPKGGEAPGDARGLPRAEVAVLYERVTDRVRDLDEVIGILKETHAGLVFRGFWRWVPCPNRCGDLSTWQAQERCELGGYSYAHLEEAISRIKAELPHLIFVGAVPAQIVQRGVVWNPKTGEIIRYPRTWELALDPAKWGLPMSKEEFQCRFGKTHFWVPRDMDCSLYDPAEAPAYFPDITNPEFQELLLSWAERQIDAGADAIWIDMLFRQASMLARIAGDMGHPAVRETWEAVHRIVDRIHAYGAAKGKRVYVGSWAAAVAFPLPPPALDFVTVSPSAREVRELRLDEGKWDALLAAIRKIYSDVPILAFIDWAGTTETPLGQFSQVLSPEEQREFLRLADEFFAERGVIFVYPVHGGWMGHDAEILSFGVSRVYDSLAPEFGTYGTIVELARRKAGRGDALGAEPGATVIAAIPFLENPKLGIEKPTWKEVEAALPELKGIGVDAIFLWGPYEHRFPEPGETITVHTAQGPLELELGPCAHILDYLEPDPERGTEEEFRRMVETAHSLGLKVIGQLQVSLSTPGDFIFEQRPEWMLESIYGEPALIWPWAMNRCGFQVNKAHSGLIEFVTEVVVPHWIEDWGLDGIYLDSPGMAYCDPGIAALCGRVGPVPGYGCLTPVEGHYTPEPLVEAMRERIEELEAETGRELIFAAEATVTSWQDLPEDLVLRACRGEPFAYQHDPRVDRSLGRHFDWVMDYNFRALLRAVHDRGELSLSENYVAYFDFERQLDAKYTELARFITIWVEAGRYVHLLRPEWVDCYITLLATAPGRILFIGMYNLPPQAGVLEKVYGLDPETIREWYARLIALKETHPALRSDEIEDALLQPRTRGLIAYNRWAEEEAVTVIVNLNPEPVECTVRTRFARGTAIRDLLSGEAFPGDPGSLRVPMPPHSARILTG